MKKLLLLGALAMFGISGCSNDDDNTITPTPLEHIWSLVSVKGGFAGAEASFQEELILWRFNTDGTVNINNKNTDTSKEDYFDSGNYSYEIKDNVSQIESCPKSMDIDGINFMCYKIENGLLILDSAPADGHTLTFKRADLAD